MGVCIDENQAAPWIFEGGKNCIVAVMNKFFFDVPFDYVYGMDIFEQSEPYYEYYYGTFHYIMVNRTTSVGLSYFLGPTNDPL